MCVPQRPLQVCRTPLNCSAHNAIDSAAKTLANGERTKAEIHKTDSQAQGVGGLAGRSCVVVRLWVNAGQCAAGCKQPTAAAH
jgi:hypothetical protein